MAAAHLPRCRFVPCACRITTSECEGADEKHPGLWQVPVWVLEDSDGGIWSSESRRRAGGGAPATRGRAPSPVSPPVPAWLALSPSRSPSVCATAVDYGNDGGPTRKASTYSILNDAFEAAYNGNRGAPSWCWCWQALGGWRGRLVGCPGACCPGGARRRQAL